MVQPSRTTARRLLAVLTLALLPVGCSKHVTVSTDDMAMVAPVASQSGVVGQLDLGGPAGKKGGFSDGAGEIRVTDQAIAMAPASASFSQSAEASGAPEASELGDIFFDYDKFTLPAEAGTVLNLDARVLKAKPGVLVIAGHCDERGSSAYNLVLGEKRARSVQQYLQDMGVDAARLRVVSYGEEKPFCQDHNDRCWRDNRRAHLALR